MSIEMILTVKERSKEEGSARSAMYGIGNACNQNGFGWCGMSEIEKWANVGRRQVINIIKRLKRRGEIAVIHRASEKKQLANLYVILLGLSRAEKKARLQMALETVKGVVKPGRRVVKPVTPPSEADFTRGSEIASAHDPSFIRLDPLESPAGIEKGQASKASRPVNPVFDAVAEHVFGIDPRAVNGDGGRIAKIAAWLKKAEEIAGPPDIAIRSFKAWYQRRYIGISLPRDLDKFKEHWVAFRQGAQEQMPDYSRGRKR